MSTTISPDDLVRLDKDSPIVMEAAVLLYDITLPAGPSGRLQFFVGTPALTPGQDATEFPGPDHGEMYYFVVTGAGPYTLELRDSDDNLLDSWT